MDKDKRRDILHRYFHGLAREDEKEWLMQYARDERNTAEINAIMEELWQEYPAGEAIFTKGKSDRIFFNLLKAAATNGNCSQQIPPTPSQFPDSAPGIATGTSLQAPTGRRRFMSRRFSRYAAVFLMAAGISIAYIFLQENKQTAPVSVATVEDTLLANEKVVLTLSDGQHIKLTDKNADLIHDGVVSIKNEDGQLQYLDNGGLGWNTMTTAKGAQYKLVLADGTRVWLNAESSVTYPASFREHPRIVKITGEAYLEVARDASKPFRVEINGTIVEVIGTHFNVNGYADEEVQKTTLLEGSVRVCKGSDSLILLPGQQAVAGNHLQLEKNINLNQVMAWKHGYFSFQGKKIREVMRELARWYEVHPVLAGNMEEVELHGEMGRDLSLRQVLNGLEGIEGLHFTLEDEILTISR